MPNHKNHLKLTGDTHPPELEDFAAAAEPSREQAVTAAPRMAEAPAQPRASTATGKSGWLDGIPFADTARSVASRAGGYASQARGRVGEEPLKALAIAAVLGFVLGKLARR